MTAKLVGCGNRADFDITEYRTLDFVDGLGKLKPIGRVRDREGLCEGGEIAVVGWSKMTDELMRCIVYPPDPRDPIRVRTHHQAVVDQARALPLILTERPASDRG